MRAWLLGSGMWGGSPGIAIENWLWRPNWDECIKIDISADQWLFGSWKGEWRELQRASALDASSFSAEESWCPNNFECWTLLGSWICICLLWGGQNQGFELPWCLERIWPGPGHPWQISRRFWILTHPNMCHQRSGHWHAQIERGDWDDQLSGRGRDWSSWVLIQNSSVLPWELCSSIWGFVSTHWGTYWVWGPCSHLYSSLEESWWTDPPWECH